MLAASAATLAAQTVEGEFERTLAVGGDTLALNIGTGSGRIAVTVGEPGVARIVGHIRGYADRWTPDAPDVVADRVRTIETNPPIVLDGDVLRVGYLDGSLHRQVGISYEMVVPANTRVRARTGSGDVRVDGVTGAVEARTGSGSMELTAVGGDVDVQSGGWAYRQAREISRFCRRTGLPVRPRPASSCQPDAPEPVSNLVG